MAQTAALFYQDGPAIDYTPGSAVVAGDVVNVGTIPMIAPVAIPASTKGVLVAGGVWKVPQKAEIFTAGDAVYWDTDGSPVTGTALSGAATGTAAAGNLMGVAVETTAATDSYVKVLLTAAKRTTTIAGSVTANDIAGSDATLTITGLEAAQGGLVSVTGGLSTTTGNAGGASSVVGGVGGATGAGGAAYLTGGASGATSGTGGAAVVTGGAAGSAAGNAVGGLASVTGGIGKGNLAGGAASLVGGVGGATGAGGAIAVTGGAGGSASGTGGAVVIAGGAGTAGNANGGALTLRGGAKNGSGADGAIAIGDANTASITFGLMPIIPSATVAATGTNQSNAAAIATGITLVTAADATTGVKLPAAAAGLICIVKNRDSDNAILKVWPNTDDAINAIAANTNIALAAKTSAIFVAYDATTWYTIPLLPS